LSVLSAAVQGQKLGKRFRDLLEREGTKDDQWRFDVLTSRFGTGFGLDIFLGDVPSDSWPCDASVNLTVPVCVLEEMLASGKRWSRSHFSYVCNLVVKTLLPVLTRIPWFH